MPPKKNNQKGPTNKTLEKEKKKVVEDKTFGLKNKNKSKQVQQKIAMVTHQVMDGGNKKGGARAQEEMKHKEKAEKQKSAAQKALLASLFKGVTQIQTNADGEVDKKRTLCPYFKAGVCEKGKKCKYSHDLTLEDTRQMAIDLYADPRAKQGKAPDTIITCRDFLEAVEKNLYGFNWECPNGGDNCTYRHMLPQGYVLKRDQTEEDKESDDEEMTLEEKIEEERAALNSEGLTPVTFETFMKWKADRAARKEAELEQKIKAEEAKGRLNKAQMAFMSGRALFQYNPDLFEDDENAADDTIFEDSDNENEESKEGAAQQSASNNDGAEEESKDRNDEEEKKEEVKVDQDLFADEGDAADEDVDFD